MYSLRDMPILAKQVSKHFKTKFELDLVRITNKIWIFDGMTDELSSSENSKEMKKIYKNCHC
jgi:hypothetical protein